MLFACVTQISMRVNSFAYPLAFRKLKGREERGKRTLFVACEYKFCIRAIKYLSSLGQNLFILFSVHTTLSTLSLNSVGEPEPLNLN